jgi:hypothetical protein
MVFVLSGGVSQHNPAGDTPYSWEACQKAGKFNQQVSKNYRNVSVSYYCSPAPSAVNSLPEVKE